LCGTSEVDELPYKSRVSRQVSPEFWRLETL
jgi:hypothetical protein